MGKTPRKTVVKDNIEVLRSIIALCPYDDDKRSTVLLLTPEELKARLQRVVTELMGVMNKPPNAGGY